MRVNDVTHLEQRVRLVQRGLHVSARPARTQHGGENDVAHGAMICLFMFPFLLIAVIVMLRALRRREI